MSDPLQVIAGSDGSTTINDTAVVMKDASGGVYPIQYTLWYRGTYAMNVVGPTGQVGRSLLKHLELLDGVCLSANSTCARGLHKPPLGKTNIVGDSRLFTLCRRGVTPG